MSNTASNNEAVWNWEDMGHTITWINNSSSQISFYNGFVVVSSTGYLSIKSQGGLDTNEESLDIESFEHNFCHLFSIFWSVQGWLSQNKSVLFRFAPKLGINGSMPEFFHCFPILNLSTSYNILKIVRLLMLKSFISNVVVKFRVLKLLTLACTLRCSLVVWVCNNCGNEITRLHISCITHLCISCSIIDNYSREFAHF